MEPGEDVPLREYVEALFNEREKAIEAALAAAEKAVAAALAAAQKATDKAEAAQKLHDEGANEFRTQLKDQVATFPTRRELEETVRRIGKLETLVANLQGRAVILASAAGIVGAIVGAVVGKALGA